MIEWFIEMLTTNSVAQGVFAGALAAAPMTALIWICRDLPAKIWSFIKRQFSQELIIFSYTDDYHDIVECASSYVLWSKSHQINDSYDDGESHKLGLGIGTHWGKFEKTFFKLEKEQEQSQGVAQFKEKTRLTFFTRKKDIKERFFQHAIKDIKEETPIYIKENVGQHWEVVGNLAPRPWESVIYHKKEELLDFINTFEASEEDYKRKGIPYHTGILLHGVPGTGKTSLIHALANKLEKHVCVLNLKTVRAGTLMSLISGNWSNKMLVIEDIDVSGGPIDRKKEEGEGITLSELLNSLDGLGTPHGMITIATTNKIESLDSALIRPGRFDQLVEVDKLSEVEAKELADLLGGTIPQPYEPMTGVELRNYFIGE